MNTESVIVLRQDHFFGTRTCHVTVLVIVTRVRTTAIVDLTSIFSYADLLILRQDHAGWTGASDISISVLVITQMGTTAVIFIQTLVLVRARHFVLR